MHQAKRNSWSLVILSSVFFALVLILTSCVLFTGRGTSNNTTGSASKYGIFRFLDPATGIPISGPFTPPASFVVDFSYKGRLPVIKLELSGFRMEDNEYWLGTEAANTRTATCLFHSENNAGNFTFYATVTDFYKNVRSFEKTLKIADPTPPILETIEFYTTEEATLIPLEKNLAYLWMQLWDTESPIFNEDTVGALREKTRFYLNGKDITSTFWYAPQEIFTTGAKNRLICIANVALEGMKNGENELRMVMGGYQGDEEDFVLATATISSSYPDTTAPVFLDYDFQPQEPGDTFVDFKVTDEFYLVLSVKDLPDKPNYEASGLKEITWLVEGEGKTLSGIYPCNSLLEMNATIPIRLRQNDFPDGVYSLLAIVSDNNDNWAALGPIYFQLGLTQYESLTVIDEKIGGNVLLTEYRLGDTIRFTIDTAYAFDTAPTWNIYPANAQFPQNSLEALYTNAQIGNHEVTVMAYHKGIPCYGKKAVTVQSTPVWEDEIPPVITFSGLTVEDPSLPFVVTVTDDTSLGAVWEDIIRPTYYAIKEPIATASGTTALPYPLQVSFLPLGNGTIFEQNFQFFLSDPLNGGSPTLLAGEKIKVFLEAQDENGNIRASSILFWK